MNTSVFEYAIVAIMLLMSFFIGWLFQDFVPYNDGFGVDGVHYKSVAEEILTGKEIQTRSPFSYRIALPVIAGLMDSENLLMGFFKANLIPVILSPFLLLFYLKFYLGKKWLRLSFVFLFLFQWRSMVRYIFFTPALTDSYILFFAILMLILIELIKRKMSITMLILFTIVTMIAASFREVLLVYSTSLFFICNPIKTHNSVWESLKVSAQSLLKGLLINWKLLISPFLGLLVFLFIVLNTSPVYSGYSYVSHATYWILNKGLAHYIHCWFIAFGTISIVMFFRIKKTISFFLKNQHLGMLFLSFLILAFIGGRTTSRLIYWLFPVVCVVVGKSIEKNLSFFNPLIWGVLIASQILSYRIIFPIIPYSVNFENMPLFILTQLSINANVIAIFGDIIDHQYHLNAVLQFGLVSSIVLLRLYLNYRKSFQLNSRE